MGAASEIEDQTSLFLIWLTVDTEGEGGCHWLRDHLVTFQIGDLARVLGSGSLQVIEVSGDGDYAVFDCALHHLLDILFDLLEHLS